MSSPCGGPKPRDLQTTPSLPLASPSAPATMAPLLPGHTRCLPHGLGMAVPLAYGSLPTGSLRTDLVSLQCSCLYHFPGMLSDHPLVCRPFLHPSLCLLEPPKRPHDSLFIMFIGPGLFCLLLPGIFQCPEHSLSHKSSKIRGE